MRILVVLVCSLALATIAIGAQKDEKKSQSKKQPQTAQHSNQSAGRSTAGGGAGGKKTPTATSGGQRAGTGHGSMASYQGQKGKKSQTSTAEFNRQHANKRQNSGATNQGQKAKNNQSVNHVQTGRAAGRNGEVTQGAKGTDTTTSGGRQAAIKGKTAQGNKAQVKTAQNKPLKPQHFNLAKQPNRSKAPPVKFQQGRRIAGSQNWQGQQYTVFRNYKSEWHDQNWWRGHYGNNITFVFGAPYYWRAGYWFPAWGYYPNAYYAWDGPIYAYNRLPPDQVIANVQSALQQQGYYSGEVDGLIGPLTRGAIADYQRDHGLYTTSTIDQPTLQSLGVS
jgi:hypothetical protein